MSNLINTNYDLKETNVLANTNNAAQVSYAGFKPHFKGAQTNDTFESSENKNSSKAIWITILSLTGLAALALGLLARKGGKTLGKDAKFSEKIEQGWKELWNKGEKAAEESTNNHKPEKPKPKDETTKPDKENKPSSKENQKNESKNNNINKPENFELPKTDKEAAERIRKGYLLDKPPVEKERARAAKWLKKKHLNPDLAYEPDVSLSYLKMFSDNYPVENELCNILLDGYGINADLLKKLDWEKQVIDENKGIYKYLLKDKNNKPIYSIDLSISDWQYDSSFTHYAKKRWKTLSDISITDLISKNKTTIDTKFGINAYDEAYIGFEPNEWF